MDVPYNDVSYSRLSSPLITNDDQIVDVGGPSCETLQNYISSEIGSINEQSIHLSHQNNDSNLYPQIIDNIPGQLAPAPTAVLDLSPNPISLSYSNSHINQSSLTETNISNFDKPHHDVLSVSESNILSFNRPTQVVNNNEDHPSNVTALESSYGISNPIIPSSNLVPAIDFPIYSLNDNFQTRINPTIPLSSHRISEYNDSLHESKFDINSRLSDVPRGNFSNQHYSFNDYKSNYINSEYNEPSSPTYSMSNSRYSPTLPETSSLNQENCRQNSYSSDVKDKITYQPYKHQVRPIRPLPINALHGKETDYFWKNFESMPYHFQEHQVENLSTKIISEKYKSSINIPKPLTSLQEQPSLPHLQSNLSTFPYESKLRFSQDTCIKVFSVGKYSGYHCTFCSLTFNEISSLSSHVQKLHSSRLDLEKLFHSNFKGEAAETEESTLESDKYKPNYSSIELQIPTNLKKNEFDKSLKIKEVYRCSFCSQQFATSYLLKLHKRKHTGDRPYKCSHCEMCFRLLSTLKTHILTHSDDKPFTCDICNMNFSQRASLRRHNITHTQRETISCKICAKSIINQKRYIKKHMAIHKRKSRCDICLKEFLNQKKLDGHFLEFHGPGGKPFKCNICNSSFSTMKLMNLHNVRVHVRKDNYVCYECKATFKRLETYHSHLEIHDTDSKHQCDICGAKYKIKRTLVRHKKSHFSYTNGNQNHKLKSDTTNSTQTNINYVKSCNEDPVNSDPYKSSTSQQCQFDTTTSMLYSDDGNITENDLHEFPDFTIPNKSNKIWRITALDDIG